MSGPFAPAPVPRPDEVRRFLRLAASSEMRGEQRVPITAIASMTGIDRRRLHAIVLGAPVSADYCQRLTPLIRQIEAGKIKFRRSGRHGDEANRWEIVET